LFCRRNTNGKLDTSAFGGTNSTGGVISPAKTVGREQAGKAESEVCEKESVNWEVTWKSVLSASVEE